jgi:hypothetical protein
MARDKDTRDNFLLWYIQEFGFNTNAATALHDVQMLKDAKTLSELDDDAVANICKAISIDTGQSVAEITATKLKLVCFPIRHQIRTLREILPNAKSSRHHDTRLDKTREQQLQDALVNVGICDVRETSQTASCWFALALQEKDKVMMLSQLTFYESESLTKAGAARRGDCLISFLPLLLGVCFFFLRVALTHFPG